MDKTIDDGGPAFPVPDTYLPNGQVQYGTNGMSLRDYFAAKALTGYISDGETIKAIHKVAAGMKISDESTAARACYEYADAMLEARKRK